MDNVNEKNEDLNIIAECTINNRTFVITANKKIYEKKIGRASCRERVS